MKMKNYLKILSSVVLLAFLGSCSNEEGKESVSWSICRQTCLTAVQ